MSTNQTPRSEGGPPRRLTPEDLAFVADALLALCDADADAPAYGDQAFRLKLRLSRLRDPAAAEALLNFAPDPLRRREMRGLVLAAGLTSRQRDTLFLRLDGFDFEGVARVLGTTRQSTRSVFLAALVKMRRAWKTYPYAGLATVYRRETRRGSRGR